MIQQNKHLAKEYRIEEYKFGHKIIDDYRYFEDSKNQEALDWIKKESQFTQDFLDENKLAQNIFEELKAAEKIFNFQIRSLRIKEKHSYYSKIKASENKAKIYKTNIITKKETLLIDLEKLQNFYQDALVDCMNFSISPNEKYLTILLAINGNEFGNTHVFDLEKNRFTDTIHANTRSFETEWLSDEEYLYVHFPNAYKTDGTDFMDTECKYHKIGTNILEDYIVFSEKNNPEIEEKGLTNWYLAQYIKETNTLLFYHGRETENTTSIYKASWKGKKTKKFERLNSFEDKIHTLICFEKEIYFFCTKFNTDFELRKCTLDHFDINKSTLVFCKEDEFPSLEIVKDKNQIYFTTTKNAYNKLYVIKNSKISEIIFEEKGEISFYDSFHHDVCPINFSNFKTPNNYFIVENLKKKKIALCTQQLKNAHELNELIIESTEYKAHDGVLVPISIVFHKDLIKNGKTKCLIHAYGSYGFNYTPYFDTKNLYWLLKQKGILAIAHVRGGGEKGNLWHLAGKKETKANTWNDLISAGEFLVSEKYTSSEYMACEGTSAGGITVGMTANKRPDLFKSILSNVGSNCVSRLGRNPGGGLSEFGNPDIEEEFETLLKMDVFENITEKHFPNILFTAGMQDDRVDYWQPAKACAKFKKQNLSNSKIYYIAYENFGHGWSGSKEKYLQYKANQYAFLIKTLSK